MTTWLDGWTNTRYLNQQELAKRWALRGTPEADEPTRPAPVKYRSTPMVCPVLEMVDNFFMLQRYPHMRRWPGYDHAKDS